MLKWLWLSVVVIALDQFTKVLATAKLALHEPVAVLPLFNLTLMHNTGAAFSFLSQAGGWQRWFFVAIAVAVSAALIAWLRQLQRHQVWLAAALALVLGGALGNVWDRIRLGYVVDFIDLYYGDWHWPAFNVADSAITVGAIMLLLDALRGERSA
ncbi:signal peptidase II [Sulfurivermis fontis]|uniref:signal peptidase II n=1 Tax=Sulfurivermis fontis TaxID=1972068 RepID=UPI000FDA00FF|nr:signal peptidase II [Sulfurivermis fontis]